VGAGTREIRIRDASGIYRVMYAAKFEEAIYVVHLLSEEDAGDRQAGQSNCRGPLSRRDQREEGKEMKIDTEIRHVTKPGANLFLDLGFPRTRPNVYRLRLANRSTIRGC